MNGLRAHWTLRRWLSAYIDGELAGDLLERVREHTLGCEACKCDLEDIRRGRDLLSYPETLTTTVSGSSRPSGFRRFPVLRWASLATLALAIIVASVWWRIPLVHAMDIDFYAAQFRMSDRCTYPCTSLVEATVTELRQSSSFPVQYPGWLPKGMVLRRVVRYRTPQAEGIGLVFADHGKELCIFQQPKELAVHASGRRTNATRICGQKCTRTDGDHVQFFNWTNGKLCFVVATNIPKDEVEAVVDSLGDLPR